MTAAAMLAAVGISKRYGHVSALRRVDLNLMPGEVLSLLGPNGAGKSTLLRVLSGLARPDEGEVRFMGRSLQDEPLALRRQLGYVSHATMLHDSLSPRENLELSGRLHGVHPLRDRTEQVLALMGVAERAEDAVGTLSRGNQQRVAIARALLHEPDLLFLDEPFSGLDEESSRALRGQLAALRERGRSILLVTHDLDLGLALADRIVVLVNGRVVHEGQAQGLGLEQLVELQMGSKGVSP